MLLKHHGQFPCVSPLLLCEQLGDTESLGQVPDGTIWTGESDSPLVVEYYFAVDELFHYLIVIL